MDIRAVHPNSCGDTRQRPHGKLRPVILLEDLLTLPMRAPDEGETAVGYFGVSTQPLVGRKGQEFFELRLQHQFIQELGSLFQVLQARQLGHLFLLELCV